MDGRISQEQEELHQHLSDLARDLQNLQKSIQASRTIREGLGVPTHVWPDAPAFDPAEDQPADWVIPAATNQPLAEPAGPEPEEQPMLVLQDYPTFPL